MKLSDGLTGHNDVARRSVSRLVELVQRWAAVLLAAFSILFLGFVVGSGVFGSEHQEVLRIRSCPIPGNHAKYESDSNYKEAWDRACEVLGKFGVETQPILEELGPLNATATCATFWDEVAATCVPSTPRP